MDSEAKRGQCDGGAEGGSSRQDEERARRGRVGPAHGV